MKTIYVHTESDFVAFESLVDCEDSVKISFSNLCPFTIEYSKIETLHSFEVLHRHGSTQVLFREMSLMNSPCHL